METELREWLDRLAIQDLIYRYSEAVTLADWQQCQAVFAPDAIWEAPLLGLRYENRESFLGDPEGDDYLRPPDPEAPFARHQTHRRDQAPATTTIHEVNRGVAETESELGTGGTEINVHTYGIYSDDIARIDASGSSRACSCRCTSAAAA
jgi:hypothetical protein